MVHRHRALCIALALLLGLVALVPIASADPGPAHTLALPLWMRSMTVYTVGSRFGVGLASSYPDITAFPGKLSDYPAVSDLGFGWYSDWSPAVTPERPNGVEFVQLLSTRSWPPNWKAIDLAIRANRGAIWIIGNEPDVSSQDNKTPAEYAAIYHEAYGHIKAVDASARIAIGGVVMPSPLRLLWLDEALDAYQSTYGTKMPVDVWNTHLQILPEGLGFGCFLPVGLSTLSVQEQYALAMNHGSEEDPPNYYYGFNADAEIYEELIRDLRTWLANRGERDKPLIVSEYGVLFPSTYIANDVPAAEQQATGDQRVVAFMQETFDFMLTAKDSKTGYPLDDNRLVQRWLWFSVNVPLTEFNGSLYDYRTRELTLFGEAYRDYVAAAKAGTLSSLPRVHAAAPAEGVERSPLPPSGLPDPALRPPYYGRP